MTQKRTEIAHPWTAAPPALLIPASARHGPFSTRCCPPPRRSGRALAGHHRRSAIGAHRRGVSRANTISRPHLRQPRIGSSLAVFTNEGRAIVECPPDKELPYAIYICQHIGIRPFYRLLYDNTQL